MAREILGAGAMLGFKLFVTCMVETKTANVRPQNHKTMSTRRTHGGNLRRGVRR